MTVVDQLLEHLKSHEHQHFVNLTFAGSCKHRINNPQWSYERLVDAIDVNLRWVYRALSISRSRRFAESFLNTFIVDFGVNNQWLDRKLIWAAVEEITNPL